MTKMKRYIWTLLLGLMIVGLPAELIDRIVAKVGPDIILMSDIYKQLQQMQSSGQYLEEELTPSYALSQMIEQKVIFLKAKELDIKIDEDRVKSYAERYIRSLKSNYPSEAEFYADLAREKMTESELLDFYIGLVREQAMSEQLVQRYVTSTISVTDQELKDFYASTKDSLAVKPLTWETGMIMIEIKPGAETEAAKLAEIKAIQQRLNLGEDFGALAGQFSDCPSKERGGDLGFFGKGMMVKPFEDAAFALNIGEVSAPVRTEFGYHLIKLEEKKGDDIRARHILKIIEATEADTLAAYSKMEGIRNQFASGAKTFAELAAEYSEDAETSAQGGIIGDLAADEMPELFASHILAAPVGQLTPVLENQGMLYLFGRLAESPARTFTFEEVREKIENYLFGKKQAEAYQNWIANLIKESYVQIIEL